MSRERDGGCEPRKEPVDRLTPDRTRDGKAEEPLRFGPEREPQGDAPKGGRPDWKKASARKVRETTTPAEPERRGDGQPPSEQAAPNQTPEPDKAEAPKGSRPAGRGPSPSQEAGAGMGQSVPKDGTGGKFRKESNQDKANRAKFRMEQREGKLDQANRKLAKQKPFKPKGPVRTMLETVSWGVHGYVHGKIYENEHENVGIEGGHRAELAAEVAGRKVLRFVTKAAFYRQPFFWYLDRCQAALRYPA